jgi:hypothetical protein
MTVGKVPVMIISAQTIFQGGLFLNREKLGGKNEEKKEKSQIGG